MAAGELGKRYGDLEKHSTPYSLHATCQLIFVGTQKVVPHNIFILASVIKGEHPRTGSAKGLTHKKFVAQSPLPQYNRMDRAALHPQQNDAYGF